VIEVKNRTLISFNLKRMGQWIMVKKDGVKRVEDKSFYSDKVKCLKCGRALKIYSECVGDRQKSANLLPFIVRHFWRPTRHHALML